MGTKVAALITLAVFYYWLAPVPAQAGHFSILPSDIHFSATSYGDGDTAVVFVSDPDLSPPTDCDATWSKIPSPVQFDEWWNLATGSPHPAHYALSAGCAFDTVSPSQTPLRPPPGWAADVDGTAFLVADFDQALGAIKLSFTVNASSTVTTVFQFDVLNFYPASSTVARIYSESDPNGELVSISEVFSESDSTPDPASALFRGQVTVSTDPGSQSPADGRVWVRHGDSLFIDYFGPGGGATPLSSSSASLTLPAPTPTPTPVPASGPISLAVLGITFLILMWWRLTRTQRPKT